MQTKNLTPFLVGAKVTSLDPPRVQMSLVVRGTFTLRPGEPLARLAPIEGLMEQGPLSGDLFRDGDDDRTGECLYASDFADFKLHAEVLLTGSCHTPGGRPMPECPVRFSVGAWSKTLVVVGPRVWLPRALGATPSEPGPFARMPLDYAHAFGGPNHPPNPAGLGRDTPELPSVEHPTARVRDKGDRPDPAGFGPLSPAWPQRAGKVGTQYGTAWKKTRAPFYAEDFDWTYFQAAPADQQLPGYLRGDEELSFVNLHPSASIFSARLPGLRIRAFVKDAEGAFREARMNLDTLLARPDEEKVVLTWRGLSPVREDDLADVKTVLVASEPLAEPPLPEAHYRAVLEEYEADPIGVEMERHAPGSRAAMAAIEAAAADDAAHPERTPNERAQAFLGHAAAFPAPEAHRADAARAVTTTQEQLAAAPATPPGDPAQRPPTAAEIHAAVTRVGEALKRMRERGEAPEGALLQIEQALEDPENKRRLAALAPVKEEEIGPGRDLSDRRLAGMDLAGKDLSGANLARADLTGACLAGARLAGARLGQAVLAGADLTGADLSGADLTQAMLGGVRAAGADLRRAVLDQAVLDDADLRGAKLAEARGSMTLLSRADLTEADLTRCDLHKAFGDEPVLARADFSEARLRQCSFLRARAEGVKLTGAQLPSTSFADGDLRSANLRGARGEGTNFSRAALADADLGRAVLPSSHFTEAKAAGARFSGADLRGADLYRACLDRADFERANLFAANLGKTTLHGTRFVRANLYDARFLGAGGKGCDLTGANLVRAMLPS